MVHGRAAGDMARTGPRFSFQQLRVKRRRIGTTVLVDRSLCQVRNPLEGASSKNWAAEKRRDVSRPDLVDLISRGIFIHGAPPAQCIASCVLRQLTLLLVKPDAILDVLAAV
ncbi:hypothetical protein H310_03729 [Aphanomyces invadans]|uniref:Uncharacterized protein n=1 Tax=Aphanomyces invadans TaxID=157072 RepID=A0A024UIL4_9STRA|nr:hypothetical protein H310_03729 [Aphanomyces invadans]ETW06144.1 hypothetical protein H310_03729 [Aphanomyces invadans]|eukprot:XP_008865921.1 hypothetical protein H310_03729 [Aphanomyces invadans]